MRFVGRRCVLEPGDPLPSQTPLAGLRRLGLLPHPLRADGIAPDGPIPPCELIRACLAAWEVGARALLVCGTGDRPFQFHPSAQPAEHIGGRPAWIFPWVRRARARVPGVRFDALVASDDLPGRRNRATLPYLPGLAAWMRVAARAALRGNDPAALIAARGCIFSIDRKANAPPEAVFHLPGRPAALIAPARPRPAQDAAAVLDAFGPWLDGTLTATVSLAVSTQDLLEVSAHEALEDELLLALPFAESLRQSAVLESCVH